MNYVNVVIDNNSRHTDSYFTYGDPYGVSRGQVVNVTFGKGNKEKTAYVFETGIEPAASIKKLKSISSVSDICLTEEIMDTCIWMTRRYGIRHSDAVKCFMPYGKATKPGKEKRPLNDVTGEMQNIDALTEEQAAAVSEISKALEAGEQKNFLIHGVTGSGKTEVYMQSIAEALRMGKTAIMLVPEIALTKQVTDRFVARFGKEKVALLHSKLTGRERFDEWMRVRSGEARIVIGARIGVFAPLENIGLIILDEEHEATYKSDQTPKYETVDVALKRLMHYRGTLILGSATPSVVSYQRAKEGIYQLIELKERYNSVPLPLVSLVDMREELKAGNRTIFSDRLYREMKSALDDGTQVILFLNRRGYSTSILCKECGEPLKCPECGITLTYHKSDNAAVCHYCGKKYPVPDECPKCGSKYIKYIGTGTEKVEEYTKQLFPDRKVERLDLDTAKNRGEINRIIGGFSKGKTDILIGTQLVAKGLDFKNVGLVGVVAADVSLNIPDYRSTERTFQLVTQVSGRAGRGDKVGRVIVQSYTPDNFALTCAAAHDYADFFAKEIKLREYMNYPPFSDMILAAFTDDDEQNAKKSAERCREYIIAKTGVGSDSIFEARPSPNFKGEESYRYQVLIKSRRGQRNKFMFYLVEFGDRLLEEKCSSILTIDVNPYSSF
jgi:primosomal protein N''